MLTGEQVTATVLRRAHRSSRVHVVQAGGLQQGSLPPQPDSVPFRRSLHPAWSGTNGQHASEKILSVIMHQGNASQHHDEII